MEFRILGTLQVLDDDGRDLPLGGAKQRATLAMLLLQANRVVSKDRLVDGLWGGAPPPSAEQTLKTYVSRLRRVLPADARGQRLQSRPPGYRLRVEGGELDAERFATLLAQGRAAAANGDPVTASTSLQEGLWLFRGHPLEDVAHLPFALGDVDRLEEERMAALEQRLEADLAVGSVGVVAELELLVVRYPFREALWCLLMLALYRAGRTGEALTAFQRARTTLLDELGVEPGPALRTLQQRILEQDPALGLATARVGGVVAEGRRSPAPSGGAARVLVSLPPEGPTGPVGGTFEHAPPPARRRLALVAVLVLVAALAVGTAHRWPWRDSVSSTVTTYRPGVVLMDARSGSRLAQIPRRTLPQAAYPVFADGHFWVNQWEPGAYREIDPRSGSVLRTISPPARDPSVHEDFRTNTPFIVTGNDLWVIAADDLVRVDASLGQETDRIHLDALGVGSGVAEGVAVGAGSIWVSRDVGQGQILRLDPATHRIQQKWADVSPHLNLHYADGSLWAGDEAGLLRIDAATGGVTRTTGLAGICRDGIGGCVAAGGGYAWASDRAKGVVYKVDQQGRIAHTFQVGVGAGWMAYAGGVLWASNVDDGTVEGFDPTTDQATAAYDFGHPIETMVAGGPVLMTSLLPGRTVSDRIDELSGRVAKFFAYDNVVGAEEAAVSTGPGSYQIEYVTCAKLLNYPDAPPPRGLQLRPEVAAAMPTLSLDRRTYTFTVRPGYRFSPPSGEVVTAETFRDSIERALSPRLAEGPTVADPPGPHAIGDIVGEEAFRRGRAEHISGLRARGDQLSITLVRPSSDFLERLALPYFCPVPLGTPFVAGAPRHVNPDGEASVPSAGPYYVAAWADGYVILQRNPSYEGPRPHTLDAIVIRQGVDASTALEQVLRGGWDGIMASLDPLLAPGGLVDQRWGSHSRAAASGDQRYFVTKGSNAEVGQVLGRHLGCRVFNPAIYGVDLAALCPRA